jgi:hypothetical protein
MQHYGVPTRLLDWTENPLVALFFAIHDNYEEHDGAVWVLDPDWLNQQTKKLGVSGAMLPDWKEAQPYLPSLETAFSGSKVRRESPVAIEPLQIDRRIAAQKSRFVIFGTCKDMADLKCTRLPKASLVKLTIKKDHIASLRRELERVGITISALFPDLEGLSQEICHRWTDHSRLPRSTRCRCNLSRKNKH